MLAAAYFSVAFESVRLATPLCDEVRVLDNSGLDKPFQPVLSIRKGIVRTTVAEFLDWASAILL